MPRVDGEFLSANGTITEGQGIVMAHLSKMVSILRLNFPLVRVPDLILAGG